MKFLGENNYQSLSLMSFTKQPYFESSNEISQCDNFMKRYYYRGEYLLNLSQILQWVNYLFHNQNKNVHKFFQVSKLLDKSMVRKVVEHSFRNSKLTLIEKNSTVKIEIISLKNEYFIGVYAMNFLRCQIPTFGFYLFANESRSFKFPTQTLSIYQEYIPGKSLRKFISENEYSRNSQFHSQFISIFLQILLALEFAQNETQFTHFDLHSENIILRPSVNYSYPIKVLNKTYKVKTPLFIPTIIDFGYSTCRLKNGDVISNMKTHYKYGYYPFFIPGTDVARVIFDLFYLVRYKNNKKISPNYLAIYNFLKFILEEFYKVDFKKFEANFPVFLKNYFNISCSKFAYRTPYDLFLFIVRNKQKVENLLNIFELPLELNPSERALNYARPDKCFKNLFCIHEIQNFCQSSKLDFEKDDLTFTKFQQQLKNSPIPKLSEIPKMTLYGTDVNVFLKKHKWFISYYEILYHQHIVKKKRISRDFYKNLITYSRFYKILISLTGYENFMDLYSPFYAEVVKDNLKYCKILNSLFEKNN